MEKLSNNKILELSTISILIFTVSMLVLSGIQAYASSVGTITQSILTGSLTTDIRDDNQNTIASPVFALGALSVSNSCQTAVGTYGSNTQRVYVDNPGAADDGWTLTIAATNGSSAKWTSGSDQYDFDDPAGSGCTGGQLILDPSVATLNVATGTSTGIFKGSQSSFNGNNALTILSASPASDDIWSGYLTGIGLSQKIPASTPAGTYVIDLTQTVTAT